MKNVVNTPDNMVVFNGLPLSSDMVGALGQEATQNSPPHHLHAVGYDEGYREGYEEAITWMLDGIRTGIIKVEAFVGMLAEADMESKEKE